MAKIGIVGNEAAKFTPEWEAEARGIITFLLSPPGTILVSGHCHLGGIDIWAEEIADGLGREKEIFPPKAHNWANGYRPRNVQIAKTSDEVHNIVVANYPEGYTGMRFEQCYHCTGRGVPPHVKSGGCWTAWLAARMDKRMVIHIIGAKVANRGFEWRGLYGSSE